MAEVTYVIKKMVIGTGPADNVWHDWETHTNRDEAERCMRYWRRHDQIHIFGERKYAVIKRTTLTEERWVCLSVDGYGTYIAQDEAEARATKAQLEADDPDFEGKIVWRVITKIVDDMVIEESGEGQA